MLWSTNSLNSWRRWRWQRRRLRLVLLLGFTMYVGMQYACGHRTWVSGQVSLKTGNRYENPHPFSSTLQSHWLCVKKKTTKTFWSIHISHGDYSRMRDAKCQKQEHCASVECRRAASVGACICGLAWSRDLIGWRTNAGCWLRSGFESPRRQLVLSLFQDPISYGSFTGATLYVPCLKWGQ